MTVIFERVGQAKDASIAAYEIQEATKLLIEARERLHRAAHYQNLTSVQDEMSWITDCLTSLAHSSERLEEALDVANLL